MGLDTNGIKFLFYASKNNIRFGKTLALGRQSYQLDKTQLTDILANNGWNNEQVDELLKEFTYAEPLLLKLGASQTDSMDASSYESATIIHDLNTPVPDHLKNQYDTVIDAGTLEHVFNFPIAIKNCMEMLKPGGHFMGITCANNFCGHGFYQFSPELFFRIFSEENGFKLKKQFFVINEPGDFWYEIPDPKDIQRRVIFENSKQTFLYIIAVKTDTKEIFRETPQQSDYEHLSWKGKDHAIKNKKTAAQKLFFFLSDPLKKKIRSKLRIIDPKAWKVFLRNMGNANKEEFRKIKND